MKKLIFTFACLFVAGNSYATSWEAKIKKIQVEGLGDDYNVVYLDHDITDSFCSRTNQENRLTIVNEAQQAAALSALMVGKTVQVMEKGNVCNAQGFAEVNYIMIYSDK